MLRWSKRLVGTLMCLFVLAALPAQTAATATANDLVFFSITFNYTCSGKGIVDCDGKTKHTSLTYFQAYRDKVTDLLALAGNRPQGVLERFGMAYADAGYFPVDAGCANGKNWSFDPTAVALKNGGKTFKTAFNCPVVTMAFTLGTKNANGNNNINHNVQLRMNSNITKPIDGSWATGFITGKVYDATINGTYRIGYGYVESRFEAIAFNSVNHGERIIQGRWDSCTFSGFQMPPVLLGKVPLAPQYNCLLRKGAWQTGQPHRSASRWRLTNGSSGLGAQCYALCMSSRGTP